MADARVSVLVEFQKRVQGLKDSVNELDRLSRKTSEVNPKLQQSAKGISAVGQQTKALGGVPLSGGAFAIGGAIAGGVAVAVTALQKLRQIARATVDILVEGFKRASREAASIEDSQVSFQILLRSVKAARDRLGELRTFAAKTPFEFGEIARASLVLETLTKGALSTNEGLRMVGDAAASVKEPFDELALQVGRAYAALQSGRPAGEALNRLNELGIVLPATRSKIEALQKEGEKGSKVWNVLAQDFARFAGTMEFRSATANGLLSTLRDSISETFRIFGAPINDAFKPLISSSIALIDQFNGLAAANKGWRAEITTTLQIAVGLAAAVTRFREWLFLFRALGEYANQMAQSFIHTIDIITGPFLVVLDTFGLLKERVAGVVEQIQMIITLGGRLNLFEGENQALKKFSDGVKDVGKRAAEAVKATYEALTPDKTLSERVAEGIRRKNQESRRKFAEEDARRDAEQQAKLDRIQAPAANNDPIPNREEELFQLQTKLLQAKVAGNKEAVAALEKEIFFVQNKGKAEQSVLEARFAAEQALRSIEEQGNASRLNALGVESQAIETMRQARIDAALIEQRIRLEARLEEIQAQKKEVGLPPKKRTRNELIFHVRFG